MEDINHKYIGKLIKKVRSMYDNCDTLEQLKITERYADLVLNKIVKEGANKEAFQRYKDKLDKLKDYRKDMIETMS